MMGTFAFPALQPALAGHWGLSAAAAGWINGVYFGAYALAVPVLASLSDRVDGRRIYLVGATIAALSWVGFAWLADGFWSAMLFRGLAGFGLAGTYLPGLKALLDRVPAGSQSRAISFYTATFSLGTCVSFLVSGWMGDAGHWRGAFLAAGASCAVACALAAWLLGSAPARPPARDHNPLDFGPVVRNRKSMGYMLAYAVHVWELFAYRSWIVAFLVFCATVNQFDPGTWTPTVIAALTGLVAMWASVAGEEFAQRFGRVRSLTVIMLASAVFGTLLGFTAAWPYPLVALLCVLYALLVQGDSAALHAGAIMNADPDRRGATMALQSLMGFAAATLSPFVVGVVLDASGGGASPASWGLAFMAMALAVAAGPWFLKRFSGGAS